MFVPGALLYGLGLLTAGLTSFYMFRSYYLAFHARRDPRGDAVAGERVHESPAVDDRAAPASSAAAALVIGALLGWPEVWGGHPQLEAFLEPVLAPARRGAARSAGPRTRCPWCSRASACWPAALAGPWRAPASARTSSRRGRGAAAACTARSGTRSTSTRSTAG